ncbi:MAG: YggS family pyridoxal phosphate-dependent enzyme [Ignavibacteriaceae bacterium]
MIAGNIKKIRELIEKKAVESKRDPDEIRLIAVSKNFGNDDIITAFNEGVVDFGENKAQELVSKYDELSNINNKIIWHFIGVLQRNKVRFAVQTSEFIHSVDSLLLAAEINKRAGKINKIQKILLEVNTSGEESKSGITEESELKDLLKYCRELPNVKPVGLMTIAPYTDNKDIVRNSFGYLNQLRNELNNVDNDLTELSMGMTNDFEIAIEEGATMLRIGTAIFGERDYSKTWDD